MIKNILLYRDATYLLPDPGGEVVRACIDEIDRLQKELSAKIAELDTTARVLQDLLFECDGITDTKAPSVVTYNHAFNYMKAYKSSTQIKEEGCG